MWIKMEKLKSDLLAEEYTQVWYENNMDYAAPHYFQIQPVVADPENPILTEILFQKGPIKESTLNGCFMEDLIAICICRLENFQKSEFACKENAMAITKLEESLMWLRKRTLNREKRGVKGTYTI